MKTSILDSLWPRPAELERCEGSVEVRELERLLAAAEEEPDVAICDQDYRLELREAGGSRLVATGEAGAFYGRQTIRQLMDAAQRRGVTEVPACRIVDAPDRLRRGVMFDVSRNKVPKLSTLKAQIERLVRCKVNEVQLYFEHTFRYSGARAVWKDASPYTAAEMRELDEFCRARFVDLVPNQQSFGHLHRWLERDEFLHLAELPEGIAHPFSLKKEPYGLCATDSASLEFLAGLYDELLPNFSSPFFHVGLDEAIDLGLGRSKSRCDEVGKARVHLEFLLSVNELVRERGKRLMYWADEQEKARELAGELPRDAVACVWGYEAGDPLMEKSAVFAGEGLEMVICPGTSSWQSFGGRTENLYANLREATEVAQEREALGMLVCDWGDRGHFQPYAIAEGGWILGAGLGWNAQAREVLEDEGRVGAIVSECGFGDSTGVVGRWLQRVGRIDGLAGGRTTNGAALFFAVFFAGEGFPHERTVGLSLEGVESALRELERLREELEGLPLGLGREDGELLRGELEWVLGMLGFACRLARARLRVSAGSGMDAVSRVVRDELAGELEGLMEGKFRELWLARNRSGGMEDSVGILGRALGVLRG